MREDRIWYEYDKIVTLIPEPSSVGSRHVQIERLYWETTVYAINSTSENVSLNGS